MNQPKCNHEPCHCNGTDVEGDGYCSQSCREGRTGADARCTCGHPECM